MHRERGKIERTGDRNVRLQKRRTYYALLSILLLLGACSPFGHPHYRPISESSAFSIPQGYQDVQIDHSTYLITYQNYFGNFGNPRDDKWLQGAHEYVLYRAGELAKSKGATYFIALYKDDWNLIDSFRGKYGRDGVFQPGAGIVMRVLRDDSVSIQPSDDRVYEVDKLLQSLPEKNRGLAEYQKKPSQVESIQKTRELFRRWRSSVSDDDSLAVPGVPGPWVKPGLGPAYLRFEPGHKITKGPTGEFHVSIWSDQYWPIAPIQLLQQCVALAESERFETFKLGNWTVEEHQKWKPWFKIEATLIPQPQKTSDTLDPVFVVEEIRSNVMNDTVRLESW